MTTDLFRRTRMIEGLFARNDGYENDHSASCVCLEH